MNKRCAYLFCFLMVLLSLPSAISAQVAPGMPNFAAFDRHEVDAVDLMNNNIALTVPVRSKSGVTPLNIGLNANSYMFLSANGWLPSMGEYGFYSTANGILGPTSGGIGFTTSYAGTCNSSATVVYTGWYVVTAGPTFHYLNPSDYTTSTSGGNCKPTLQDVTQDGSGFTLKASGSTITGIYGRDGTSIESFSLTDSNSNTITYGSSGFTDTMGLLAVSMAAAYTWSWPNVNGGNSTLTESTSTPLLKTAFACSGITDIPGLGNTMPTGFSFPDGTALGLTYEATPGTPGDITGRINEITLREGGTVSYTYGGTHNGIDCTYQTVPVLTRKLGNGDTTTYTLTHSLISGSNYKAVNTVVDPAGDTTVYTFTGFTSTGNSPTYGQVLTEVQRYQGTSSLLSTDIYCYNIVFSSCSTTSAPSAQTTLPISEQVVFHQLGVSTSPWSATETHFDTYGNVTYSAQYDFGGTSPVQATTITYGSCTAGCGTASPTIASIGSNINDRAGKLVTAQNANVSQTNFTYNSHGNLLTTNAWTGTMWLSNTTANTYNANGTPSATYDLANHSTTYAYSSAEYVSCGSCTQYPFPTSITRGGLTVNATYNGAGGVKLTDLDANGNTTTYGYATRGGTADPFWRVSSVTDPLGDVAYTTYTANAIENTATFGSSVEDVIMTVDGYGRPIRKQSKHGSSYDTVTTQYNDVANTISTSIPCLASLGGDCTTGFTASSLDGLGRASSVVDGGAGTLTNSFPTKDVVSTLSPPPTGENNKTTQLEFDGLGRTTSSCSILSTGGTACGQVAGGSGIPTTFAYSSSAGATTITATRGVEQHTTVKDGLERITSQTTPEGGTTTYLYDSWSAGLCGQTNQPGHLMLTTDANGSFRCYAYEFNSIGRLTDVGYGNGTGECRHFRYDTSANGLVTPPGTIVNGGGHIVEATTDNCSVFPPTSATIITDEWFSYDKLGNMTDLWQLSPSSLGYLHTSASWFPNGQLHTLNSSGLGTTGGITGIGALTYGLDANGNSNTAMLGTTPIVAGVTYGPVGPQVIDIGSGTDQDQYTYSPTTGRMTNYQFYVGSANMTGGINWSPNGTLGSLAITDGFNSGGTQTCAFGYDDVSRLVSDNCGSIWSQTFAYDQYDNLSKTGNPGISWMPGYNTKNQYSTIGATYDASGYLTYDGSSYYTWDAFGKLAGVNIGGPVNCGVSGTCITYDAFGRAIEENQSGLPLITLYSPIGKVGLVYNYLNQGIIYVYTAEIPMPGGGTLAEGGGAFYVHKDWLGTARVSQTVPSSGNGSVIYDYAFAPYGEEYDAFGMAQSSSVGGFTGDWSYLIFGGPFYDTPNRELHSGQGRWLSPDPAGQGWNQYAYPTNPNSFVDPSGLFLAGPGGCNQVDGCGAPGFDDGGGGTDYQIDGISVSSSAFGGFLGSLGFPGGLGDLAMLSFQVQTGTSVIGVDANGTITVGGCGGLPGCQTQESPAYDTIFPFAFLAGLFGPGSQGPAANNWQPALAGAQTLVSINRFVNAKTSDCYNSFHQTTLGTIVQGFSAVALTPVANNYQSNQAQLGAEYAAKGLMVVGSNYASTGTLLGQGLFTGLIEDFAAIFTAPAAVAGTGADASMMMACQNAAVGQIF